MKVVAVAFGRMNPPTIGHMHLVRKLSEIDADDHYIYLSHTQDAAKNPLSYEDKIKMVRSCIEEQVFNVKVIESPAKNLIEVLGVLSGLFDKVIVVTGEDRREEYTTRLNMYNGIPDKSGKLLYSFDEIEVVSAGARDPDAESVEGMSATKMRHAAANEDFESFKKGVATKDSDLAFIIYTKTREGMKLNESLLTEAPMSAEERNYLRSIKPKPSKNVVPRQASSLSEPVKPEVTPETVESDKSIEELNKEELTKVQPEIASMVNSRTDTPVSQGIQYLYLFCIYADPFTIEHQKAVNEYRRLMSSLMSVNKTIDYRVLILPSVGGKDGVIIKDTNTRAYIMSKLSPANSNIIIGKDITAYVQSLRSHTFSMKGIYWTCQNDEAIQKQVSNLLTKVSQATGIVVSPLTVNNAKWYPQGTWDKPNVAQDSLRIKTVEMEDLKKRVTQEAENWRKKNFPDEGPVKEEKKQESFYMNSFARRFAEGNKKFIEQETTAKDKTKKTDTPKQKFNPTYYIQKQMVQYAEDRFVRLLPGGDTAFKKQIYRLYYLTYEDLTKRASKVGEAVGKLTDALLGDILRLVGAVGKDLGFTGAVKSIVDVGKAGYGVAKAMQSKDTDVETEKPTSVTKGVAKSIGSNLGIA